MSMTWGGGGGGWNCAGTGTRGPMQRTKHTNLPVPDPYRDQRNQVRKYRALLVVELLRQFGRDDLAKQTLEEINSLDQQK